MATAITLSEGVTLAIHGISIVAYVSPRRLNIKQVAKMLESSEAHLAKIFQKLSKVGLVDSVRGPQGGFSIPLQINEITFLDVYEAIEGKLMKNVCPLGKKKCVFNGCLMGDVICKLSNEFYDQLKATTLQNLVDDLNVNKFKLQE